MRNSIRFLLGTEIRELRDVDPTLTVLNYLREHEGRCGTKEGCAEGDCGACTVALVERDGDEVTCRAVSSCIEFVPTLDGRQLLTVEDLSASGGRLHPAQAAMVEANASQCGFCTPGFVMSLYAMYRNGDEPERQRIDDTLAGNLCRCTGYGSIIEAARRMGDAAFEAPAAESDATLGRLAELAGGDSLALSGHGTRYFAPTSADELATLLLDHPDACLLAGGTDVGLWVTKRHRRLDPLVYLGKVAELREIEIVDDMIEIGAAVTYSDAMDLICEHYPDFGELLRRLGSVQIRNLGTIGGNVANGSPIGDALPALIAAGAELVLRKGEARRTLLLEDYFIDYGKQDRTPGEFVERIRLPVADPAVEFRAYKLSKRFDQDISAVCGAYALRSNGGAVADIRICYGGMATTPCRATHAEAALRGRAFTRTTVTDAMNALSEDYTPISDMRASADYRFTVARNLLFKFYLEASGEADSLRLAGQGSTAYG